MSHDSPPPAPDYSPIMNQMLEVAKSSQGLSTEQWDFFKELYGRNADIIDTVTDRAMEVSDFMLDIARRKDEQEQAFADPLKEQAAFEAENYASPERIASEMGRAASDVAQNFENQRQTAAHELEQYGMDPSQTRQAALNLQGRAAEGAAQAAAANQARLRTEETGRQLRDRAIGYFASNPQYAQSAAQGTLAAGNQGVNANLAGAASAAQTQGTPTDWSKLALTGMNNSGDLMSNIYKSQIAGYEAESKSNSGWGEALGTLAGAGLKLAFAEEGGAIPDQAELAHMAATDPRAAEMHGGMQVPPEASPSGGAAIDDVPAQLNVGEFVIPKDVVRWHGEKFFQNLIQKARKDEQGAPAKPEAGNAKPSAPTVSTTGQAVPV